MSHSNERTPLLPTHAQNGSTTAQSIGQGGSEGSDVGNRALSILHTLKHDPDEVIDSSLHLGPEDLLVLLYALQHLETFIGDATVTDETNSISASVLREGLTETIRRRLDTEVGKILDIGRREGVDDEYLCDALWKRWYIGDGTRLSALDILSNPRWKAGNGDSPFLSHPMIVRFIEHIYSHVPWPSANHGEEAAFNKLQSAITPRRAHILHFISYLTLWALTVTIALRPNSWIFHTHTTLPTVTEIIWMLNTSAAIVQLVQHPRQLDKVISILPSVVSLLTSWTSYGSFFLQLSIPFLTISMMWPAPPSTPFLFSSLLPHSVRLWSIVIAAFKGWYLIWPIIMVCCVAFSISLNGNIFRGLFVISTRVRLEDPIEEGVSPYGTRVAIFGTILLLLYMAINLSILNIIHSNRMTHSASDSTAHDWDREHGANISVQARAEWVRGIRWLIGDMRRRTLRAAEDSERQPPTTDYGTFTYPPAAIPLNILFAPIDLLDLVGSITPERTRAAFRESLHRVRYILTIMIVGIPCWLLSVVL